MAFNDITSGSNACSEYCCPKDLADGKSAQQAHGSRVFFVLA